MKGLIIDEPWITLIVAGDKTWEMRSRDTRVRGRIGLIRKGSKMVVGAADLIGTFPSLLVRELRAHFARHRVPAEEIDEDFRWRTAWVLEHAQPLGEPIPYRHLAGAVIWVNLDPAVGAAVEAQLSDD